MEPNNLILIALATGVLAADVLIRLRFAPARRDRWIESLVGMFSPAPDKLMRDAQVEAHLANSLLKHFERSFASRQIVAALAETPRGMTEKDLERRFTEVTGRLGKPAMPSGAIRKVIMNLMRADFVSLRGGKLKTTELGRNLHAMLQERPGG